MAISRLVYKLASSAWITGLALLFTLRFAGDKAGRTGWPVWLASGLFCGGLFLALAAVLVTARIAPPQDHADDDIHDPDE